MSLIPSFDSVSVGDELAPLTMTVDRARLVRYAGASGDFNRIHWSESTAAAVGLPGILAHGMLTMALADPVGDHPARLRARRRRGRHH